jgi:hypothetical protein
LSAFINAEETMTLKVHTRRTSLNAALFLILLACLVFNPAPVFGLGEGGAAIPEFAEFSRTVQNNNANALRGVYVPNVLALPITQQPVGDSGYVSSKEGEITQFGLASQYGNVGLLAHNHLSGRLFSQLALGQEVRLVYGNGNVEYFIITQILQYQALQPTSQYSDFRDLSNNAMLTVDQVFDRVYRGEHHVTFQTCIANTESLSWGRLFVIAIPKAQLARMEDFFGKNGR